MLIITGKRRTSNRHGYVADFCPLCRDVREVAIWRFGRARHLYGVALDEGELLGFEAVCLTCRHRWPTDAADYAEISEHRVGDLEALTSLTFPDLRRARGERLEIERVVRERARQLAPDVRAELLREPFVALAPILHDRGAGMRLDGRGALVASLVFVVCCVGIVGMVMADGPATKITMAAVFSIGGLLGGLWTIKVIDGEPSRWYRRRLVARVARWLRPLRPTQGEMEQVVAQLRTEGSPTAELTDVELLLDLVHKPEQADRLDPLLDGTANHASADRVDRADAAGQPAGPLAPPTPRIALLRAPIVEHAQSLRDRQERTHCDAVSLLAGMLTIGAVVACVAVGAAAEDQDAKLPFMVAAMVIGCGGGLYTIRLIDRESHRWFRRRVLPRVARSLLSLRPTRHELEQVLERLRAEDELVGRVVSADGLADLLQRPEEIDRLDPPRFVDIDA